MTTRTSSRLSLPWILAVVFAALAVVFLFLAVIRGNTIEDLQKQAAVASATIGELQKQHNEDLASLKTYREVNELDARNNKAESDRAIQLGNEIQALLAKAVDGVPVEEETQLKTDLAAKLYVYPGGAYVTKNVGELMTGATSRPALSDGREIPGWVYGPAGMHFVSRCVTDGVAAMCAERIRR